jgi:GDPmannose 4,6-dehydratase
MLQVDNPQDFVIGTGRTHSVREFCEAAFHHVGLDNCDYVVQDQRFYRPAEVDMLVADPSKARKEMNWAPDVNFEELVQIMVDADLKRVSREMS